MDLAGLRPLRAERAVPQLRLLVELCPEGRLRLLARTVDAAQEGDAYVGTHNADRGPLTKNDVVCQDVEFRR